MTSTLFLMQRKTWQKQLILFLGQKTESQSDHHFLLLHSLNLNFKLVHFNPGKNWRKGTGKTSEIKAFRKVSCEKKTSVRNFMKDRHRLETPRISNKIFLSLRFYVKSILENLGVLRLAFIAIFVLQPSISAKIHKKI